jgi:hypothetical protein
VAAVSCPVVASLSKTVSEDTVSSTSSPLPGATSGGPATSATSENSSLGGDADLSAASSGATAERAVGGGPSSVASELSELRATSEVTSGAVAGGASAKSSGAVAGRAASELATSSGASSSATVGVACTAGRLTEPLAGSPASHASGVGSALALVGRGGDLLADGSHAVGAVVGGPVVPLARVVPVWVVSAVRVVGVGPEWVATSGEVSTGSGGSGLVATSVSAIASYVLVASIEVVTAADVGVSSESAVGWAPASNPAPGVCSLSILASVHWSSLQLR